MLVNNAGFGIHGEFAQTDIESRNRSLNVQLTAALKLTKAVLPAMIAEAQRTDPQRRIGLFLCAGAVSIGLQRVQGVPAFLLCGNS